MGHCCSVPAAVRKLLDAAAAVGTGCALVNASSFDARSRTWRASPVASLPSLIRDLSALAALERSFETRLAESLSALAMVSSLSICFWMSLAALATAPAAAASQRR